MTAFGPNPPEDLSAVVVIRGRVEHGDQRGRQLGFPTANVPIGRGGVGDGVWAGWLDRCDGERLPAAISVGRRATVHHAGERLLEAHVIGFDGDLYGEVVTVWLVEFLRGQQRFPGLDALIAQLRSDVADAHQWCTTSTWTPPAVPGDLPVGTLSRLAWPKRAGRPG